MTALRIATGLCLSQVLPQAFSSQHSRCLAVRRRVKNPDGPSPGLGIWKEDPAEKSSGLPAKKIRTKPPPPIAAPPAKPILECDPDTVTGRAMLVASSVKRLATYAEGSFDKDFLAVWNHICMMKTSTTAGSELLEGHQVRLASFLAAAGVATSNVGTQFETMQLQEHKIWFLPLLHMWTPACGCPKALIGSRMHTFFFAHGTDDVGMLGILAHQKMRRSFPSEGYPTCGFFCLATNDFNERMWPIVKCWFSAKNEAGVLVVGMAATDGPHRKVESGGVLAAQEACARAKVAHCTRRKDWCIHPDAAQVLGLAVVQSASLHTGSSV